MSNADRLRLARKMRIPNTVGWNPFTDANDDYAVLGWMRANGGENVIQGYKINYRIGDYARAALKVIE